MMVVDGKSNTSCFTSSGPTWRETMDRLAVNRWPSLREIRKFFGEHLDLADAEAFADWLMPLRQCEWVVYAKRPFAGPEQVLAYLSRYTHRVAISNSRLVALDDRGVTFRWKDYREQGRTRFKTMSLATEEFMRRFLLHVLPSGFHARFLVLDPPGFG